MGLVHVFSVGVVLNPFQMVAALVGAKILLNLVPIVIKLAEANVWTIGIFRLFFTCLFFALITKNSFYLRLQKTWILGVIFFVHWLTYFIGVKSGDPSATVIGLCFYGLILMVYSRVFQGKKMQRKYFLGVLFSIFGTYLAVGDFDLGNENFIGFLWGVASATAYAFLPIFHQRNLHISTQDRAYSQFLGAFVLFLIIGWQNFDLDFGDYTTLSALAYLTVGGTILGHTLWVKITEQLETRITSCIYYVSVPISMFFERIFLGVPLTGEKLMGGLIILIANVFVVYKPKRSKMIPAQKDPVTNCN